ncbi:MAG: competence/damage-inducible protein A [Akkermansiaceae bacterium]|nr:competence/damage-inducible protein A [Akkermansiaceae bacterium]
MSLAAPSADVVPRVTAAILVIGDEILSGRTKDQNIGWIADTLTAIGIDLREVRIVADDATDIIAAVNALRGRYTYVFTTGGIGPTHDDITADCIAAALGVPIDVDPRAVAIMQPYYDARGVPLTEARLRMARVPAGATLIANSVSAAPGFMAENVIVMAGVPAIMRVMLADALPHLARSTPVESRTIQVPHPEGEIAELLRRHQDAYPTIAMGSYPRRDDGRLTTELVLRSADPVALSTATEQLIALLAERGLVERIPSRPEAGPP